MRYFEVCKFLQVTHLLKKEAGFDPISVMPSAKMSKIGFFSPYKSTLNKQKSTEQGSRSTSLLRITSHLYFSFFKINILFSCLTFGKSNLRKDCFENQKRLAPPLLVFLQGVCEVA